MKIKTNKFMSGCSPSRGQAGWSAYSGSKHSKVTMTLVGKPKPPSRWSQVNFVPDEKIFRSLSGSRRHTDELHTDSNRRSQTLDSLSQHLTFHRTRRHWETLCGRLMSFTGGVLCRHADSRLLNVSGHSDERHMWAQEAVTFSSQNPLMFVNLKNESQLIHKHHNCVHREAEDFNETVSSDVNLQHLSPKMFGCCVNCTKTRMPGFSNLLKPHLYSQSS